MKLRHIRLVLIFAFCSIAMVQSLYSTHVVGGNLTYRCLGNSRYEVSLDFRRDCFNGATDAQFDDPAAIGIFDENGFLVEILGQGGMILIPLSVNDTLNETVSSECNVIGGDVCTQTTTYRDTIILPFRNGGYYLAYQRCCRNATLNNIVDPLRTGATYWIRITEQALQECNSSPVFRDWPISFVCVDDTLRFDHSAIDADGDSLVYELCSPSTGATIQFPKPIPPGSPPYGEVQYNFGFSANRPLGLTVPININSGTGELFAVPDKVGQYLIGVCVREFRDGVLLSEVRRDFEYNVRVCGRAPVVGFETDPPGITMQCDGLEMSFSNSTTSNFLDPDSLSYTWYFDWPDNTLVSTDPNPTVLFPEPGLYTIALIADDGTCQDTFLYDLGLSLPDDPLVDFSVESSNCEGSVEIYLRDLTESQQEILERRWIIEGLNFMDTLYGLTPTTEIFDNQIINITLEVTTESGCNGSFSDLLDIQPDPFENIFEDQIICDNQETIIFTNSNEGADVIIVPDDNIQLIGNDYILTNFTGQQEFTITVSDSFCFDSGTVSIQTFPRPDLGLQDLIQCGQDTIGLNPFGDPDYFYDWSSNGSFDFNNNETNPLVSLDQSQEYYVIVYTEEGSNCFAMDTTRVTISEYPEFDFFPSDDIITCLDEPLTISVNSTDSVVWTTLDDIQIGTGPELILNQVVQDGTLLATVTNDSGCTTSKEVNITTVPQPVLNLQDILQCGQDSVELNPLSDPTYFYEWSSNGDLDFDENTANPKISLNASQEYYVTAYSSEGSNCFISDTVNVIKSEYPEFEFLPSANIITCIDSSLLISVTNTTDSIVWTTSNGTQVGTGPEILLNQVTQNGVLIATATNLDGCITSKEVRVNISSEPDFSFQDDSDMIVCIGGTANLAINSTDSLVWYLEDGTVLGIGNQITIDSIFDPLPLTITAFNQFGCPGSQDIIIELYDDPEYFIVDSTKLDVCFGESTTLEAFSEDSIYWYDLDGNLISSGPSIFIPDLQVTPEVIISVVNEFDCEIKDTLTFNILELPMPDLEALNNIVVCKGFDESIVLTSGDSITWLTLGNDVIQIGPQLDLFNIVNDTIYQVSFVSDLGCEIRDTFSVTVQSDIEMVLQDNLDNIYYCTGDPVNLYATTVSDAEIEWFENNVSLGTGNDIIINPVGNTIIVAVATDSLGCTETDSIAIFESIVNGVIVNPESLCIGETIALQFIPDTPGSVESVIWMPDSLIIGDGFEVMTNPEMNTSYSVIVTDTVGCTAEFTSSVLVGGFGDPLEATADPDEILLSESSQLD
ncbi:MAG: hypothetical protein KJO50_01830, partial [Bacteroidia bacterium]|nr:hypothetical protein [Bacteroidia bacterium]